MSAERFEQVYPVWARYVALDRKFLPSEIRKQPDALMDDILYIDSLFQKMVAQADERRDRKKAK